MNKFFIENKGFIAFTGTLLLIVGLVFSVYTKRYVSIDRSDLANSRKVQELVALLKETKSKNTTLNEQLVQLNEKIKTIKEQGLSVNLASKRLKEIYVAAGFTQVQDKGIVITVDDTDNIKNDVVNFDTLLNGEDLLQLVNVLKASDATAISVNGQRIVTTSEIVTAGDSIVINKTKLIPPYLISAIGPVGMMTSALKMRGGVVEYLKVFGIKIDIEQRDDLIIPAYKDDSQT